MYVRHITEAANLDKNTVGKLFWQVIVGTLDCVDSDWKVKVGGPGTTVQIDEVKFAKRKYNRGSKSEEMENGSLVDTNTAASPPKMFLVPVDDRKRFTLREITKYVLPGTLIITDGWKTYEGLEGLPGYHYQHQVANHTKHFKDPITGVCTNSV